MTVPTVYPGSPRARATDPITSHEAADATQGSVAASQAAVISILTGAAAPLSDQQIARAAEAFGYRFSGSRLRTARHELEEDGVVVKAGTVKHPGRTRMAVWTLREAS